MLMRLGMERRRNSGWEQPSCPKFDLFHSHWHQPTLLHQVGMQNSKDPLIAKQLIEFFYLC